MYTYGRLLRRMNTLENLLKQAVDDFKTVEAVNMINTNEHIRICNNMEYLRTEGYKLDIQEPDNRHYHLTLIDKYGKHSKTVRFEK